MPTLVILKSTHHHTKHLDTKPAEDFLPDDTDGEGLVQFLLRVVPFDRRR